MITVYCAHCHRPLAHEIPRVSTRTETCVRQPVAKLMTSPSGLTYLLIDGNSSEMECSTMVMNP